MCSHIMSRNSCGSCGKSVKVLVCGRSFLGGSRFGTACGTGSYRQLGTVVIVDHLHTIEIHHGSGKLPVSNRAS